MAIRIGNDLVSKLMLGAAQVSTAYLGTTSLLDPPTPTADHRLITSAHIPDSVTASGTYVRMNRKRERIAASGKGKHFLLVGNFYMSNGTLVNGVDTITQNGTVEYNGVLYPLRYNGQSSYTLAPGEIKAVEVVGLANSVAGQYPYYNIRNIHSNTGSVNRIRGVEINARFDEGVVAGTNPAVDNSSGYGMGSTATATVVGGAITAISFNNTAANGLYTSGDTLIAYQTQADGTILQRVIGTYATTGGNPSSATITDVNTDWVAPTIQVCSRAASFGAVTGDIYAPLGMIAIPNDSNARQIVIVGDSNGHSSADATMSAQGYKGLYERGINGRYATFNMSFSGRKASDVANISSGGLSALYNAILPYISDVLIALGGNDAATDTAATIKGNLNAQAAIWRAAGKRVGYSTIPPRTTGTFASAAGQTPATGFASGGVVDSLNTEFRAKTITSDFNAFEFRTPVQDTGNPNVWRSDLSRIWTDGTHLTQVGVVNIDATATGALST